MVDALGVGVVNVVNSFDPEVVILGGRLTLAGDLVVERLQQIVADRAMVNESRPVSVWLSSLQSESAVIGAQPGPARVVPALRRCSPEHRS